MSPKKCLTLLLFVAVFAPAAFAQRSDEWPVVLQLPGMERVEVEQVIYKKTADTQLRMDVYYPPGFDDRSKLPGVIIHNCFSRENADVRGYRDWGKLIAVSGMIGIGHQSRFYQAEDSEDLVNYIRAHADELHIDAERLGIWTSSGNALIGVPLVMRSDRPFFRCAAIYYSMLDPEDVKPLKPLRQDLSLFMVRCGLDEFRASRNIDAFIPEALNADLDFELVNYLEGHHAFDIVDNNVRSREIIKRTLDFFQRHLIQGRTKENRFVFTAKNFYAMMKEGRVEEAKRGFQKKVEERNADNSNNPFYHREIIERGMNLAAQELIKDGKTDRAIEVIDLMIEVYPRSPVAFLGAADGYKACGRLSLAIESAEKALALARETTEFDESQKEALQKSAREKLAQWKKENR